MKRLVLASLGVTSLLLTVQATAQFTARDPGLRGDPPGAGRPLPGLTARQRDYFAAGLEAFQGTEGVGDGLGPRFNLEQIPDSTIVGSAGATASSRSALGIGGRPNQMLPAGDPNRTGNDGTIARFGWKAQNKSLLLFAGEAYNVEMGISNELFPTERDETPGCQYRMSCASSRRRRRRRSIPAARHPSRAARASLPASDARSVTRRRCGPAQHGRHARGRHCPG